MSVYGSIVSGSQVDDAVLAHLQDWLPAYLNEAARQAEVDVPTMPRTWAKRVDGSWWPEDRFPVVVVTTQGIQADGVERRGDGAAGGWFVVSVTAFVNGKSADDARLTAQTYTAALRAAVVQHGALGGFAQAIDWRGEGYDLIDAEDEARVYAGGQIVIGVLVEEIVNAFGGPATPPTDPGVPGTDDPTVASHTEVLIPKTSKEEL